MALLSTTPGINICKEVINKIKSRYTAENSLISSMALLGVVAATHFFSPKNGLGYVPGNKRVF